MNRTIDYGIKFIHPDWYLDHLRDKRVGFPKREYRNALSKGAKLLIYLTTAQKEHMYSPIVKEFQRRIVGIYTVLGNFKEGEHFPDKKPGYPLNIPVEIEYIKPDPREGVALEMNQQSLPWFYLRKGQSLQPISEEEYLVLRNLLINS